MEALAAVFKELYTSFLLRDFAGKIVPGIILIISVSTVYASPFNIFSFFTGRLSTALIFFMGGFAWIIVLGVQGLTNSLHIWRYYPDIFEGKPLQEIEAQLVVQQFLQLACQADRQQYERLVVIKEATGNLFAVSCISLIFLFSAFIINNGFYLASRWTPAVRTIRFLATISCIAVMLIGLKLMNSEHIWKQYAFAASFVARGAHMCPVDKKAES